jgi:hypothetical protein
MTALTSKPIIGNRLKVYTTLSPRAQWTVYKGERIEFAKFHDARVFAEKKGFDDGIHIQFSRKEQWQGLKPQIDRMLETPESYKQYLANKEEPNGTENNLTARERRLIKKGGLK